MPLLAGLLVASLALANPSASVDSKASRNTDESTSEKITRDKSLDASRSSGNKTSRSTSQESSRESSRESKTSRSSKADQTSKDDYSMRVNVNALILRAFIENFEAGGKAFDPKGGIDIESATAFFRVCRPISNLDTDFPVLAPGGSISFDPNEAARTDVLPLSSREGWLITTKNSARVLAGNLRDKVLELGQPPAPQNLQGGAVGMYGICRLAAHYWLAGFAEEWMQSTREIRWPSQEVIYQTIKRGMEYYARSPELWRPALGRAVSEFMKARCSPFLTYYPKDHNLDCGVLRIEGNSIYANGVPTLSAEAIDGKKFEMTYGYGDSSTQSASRDQSSSVRQSSSSKASHSTDSYAEAKRGATMKTSKSSDSSASNKTSRDTSTGVSASGAAQ